MPTNPSPAVQTSLAYFHAWTGGDFEKAMTFVSKDIVCRAPAGTIEGADEFRNFMGPFSQILTRSSLVAAFGDDTSTLLMYDADTVPVPNAPGAEHHTVHDGLITELRIIFDSAPFEAAQAAAASS